MKKKPEPEPPIPPGTLIYSQRPTVEEIKDDREAIKQALKESRRLHTVRVKSQLP